MATSPATAPEAIPSTVGLPRDIHSEAIQPSAAAAAAVLVVTKAFTATPEASSALPALKPNHPNQRRPASRRACRIPQPGRRRGPRHGGIARGELLVNLHAERIVDRLVEAAVVRAVAARLGTSRTAAAGNAVLSAMGAFFPLTLIGAGLL